MKFICIVTYTFFDYIWVANFQPLLVCWRNPFLAPCHVIRMFSCPSNFRHTKYIVIFTDSGNMSILNQNHYCLSYISYFTLETCVLILDSINLIFMVFNNLLQLSLFPNGGLLMIFFHPVSKLLPNMRKQQIAAVSSEVFCFWLLNGK